ncbi:MAG: hypothetical protein ABI876_12540 [Bacteroidota bacterium]
MKTFRTIRMILSMMCGAFLCLAVAGLGLYLITPSEAAEGGNEKFSSPFKRALRASDSMMAVQ